MRSAGYGHVYIHKKDFDGRPIPVFNNGNLKRDFTYIDDIISGTQAGIDKNYKCEVFNLGNHKSEQLMGMILLIEKGLKKSNNRILTYAAGRCA